LCGCDRNSEPAQDDEERSDPEASSVALPIELDPSACAHGTEAASAQGNATFGFAPPLITGPDRTSNPLSAASLAAQPLDQFLANVGLQEHKANLIALGVTHLSHMIDVSEDDLIAFMTPLEAKRIISSLEQSTRQHVAQGDGVAL
jgi:hypothetical protein